MQPVITAEEEIASIFVAARLAGRSLAAFPGVIPATLEAAYRVQDFAIARMSDSVGGWKVGRIFPPQSEQFGMDRLAGPIFSRSIQHIDTTKPLVGTIFVGGFGAAEAEFLFRLKAAPDPAQKVFSLQDAAALIDRVHVGIEIASSPLATINALGPPVIVSDFGNNNGLLVGPQISNWQSGAFTDWPITMLIDGVKVGQGMATAFPDGPIGSVQFLLTLMARRAITLSEGCWVSSGAISGVHDVLPGQIVEARFGSELRAVCTIAVVPRL